MSQKAMVFIDGAWLYKFRSTLFSKTSDSASFEIDYARLPYLLCEKVADKLDEDISLVRTYYFGTVPSPRNGFNLTKQHSFYDFLEDSCNYEMDIHTIDVNATTDNDAWIPVALATSLIFHAAQPSTFDIAIIISDDPNLAIALRRARTLGKRIQIVTSSTESSYKKLAQKIRTSDFKPLILDEFAPELRLVRAMQTRVCKECGKREETTWAGPEFFCDNCRRGHRDDPA